MRVDASLSDIYATLLGTSAEGAGFGSLASTWKHQDMWKLSINSTWKFSINMEDGLRRDKWLDSVGECMAC